MRSVMFLRPSTVVAALLAAGYICGCAGCPPTPSPTPTPTPTTTTSSTEVGITVKLVEHTGTDPEKPSMSASGGTDHIRWSNETTQSRTIHFTVDWPFLEPSGDIVVPPGSKSPWFTLDPAKVSSGGTPFPYEVTPPLVAPSDPPEEPSISGET